VSGYAIRQWPAADRPRERLRQAGADALSVRELLAILIGSGTRGRSAVEVAADLMRRSGSLRRIAGSPARELERVAGVGPAVASRVCAALELGRRLAREAPEQRRRVRSARDVFDLCAPSLRDLVQEEFRVLMLNTQHAVTGELAVTRGTLDTSVVHAREVFRAAVMESAAAVILVHNHPSGDPTPSVDDRDLTRQLAAAGRTLGIPVLDHVIIGDGCYLSFAEAGLHLPV
jgi:DNA repair protein RadC